MMNQRNIAKENEYNGYANYETWNVCLWIDNDRDLYFKVDAWVKSRHNSALGYILQVEEVKTFIQSQFPEGYTRDLAFLLFVDWQELTDILNRTH